MRERKRTLYLQAGIGAYALEATVITCGNDVVVVIGGGEAPHIGASAIASPRPSLKNDGTISATASVFCVMGHKDDMLARKAAIVLASALNTTVLVSVGLHIDDATTEDIVQLGNCFDNLLKNIITAVCSG